MTANERLIEEVNGTMAIEGMALNKDDRKRLSEYLNKPESFNSIMTELIKKYSAPENKYVG
jgi:hypothetical protein